MDLFLALAVSGLSLGILTAAAYRDIIRRRWLDWRELRGERDQPRRIVVSTSTRAAKEAPASVASCPD